MTAEIIDNDDTTGLELRDKELLDPCGKACPVDRSVEYASGDDVVASEVGNEGQRLPAPRGTLPTSGLPLSPQPWVRVMLVLAQVSSIKTHTPGDLGIYLALEPEPAATTNDVRTTLLLGTACRRRPQCGALRGRRRPDRLVHAGLCHGAGVSLGLGRDGCSSRYHAQAGITEGSAIRLLATVLFSAEWRIRSR